MIRGKPDEKIPVGPSAFSSLNPCLTQSIGFFVGFITFFPLELHLPGKLLPFLLCLIG